MGERIQPVNINGKLFSRSGEVRDGGNPFSSIKIVALGRREAAAYQSLHEILALFETVKFVNEKNVSNVNDIIKLSYSESVNLVLMPNPYGNGKRTKLYRELKEQHFPVVVFDRGGLPGSWFFDVGFNADSSTYSPILWDKPLTQDMEELAINYVQNIKSSGEVLEVQGARVGGQVLREKLGLQGKKVLFVPFQRPGDTTIRFFGGLSGSPEHFQRMILQIERLLNQNSNEWVVIGKKHPLEKVGPSIPIRMAPEDAHIYDLLELSEAVCLVNSGTGLLASLWDKPVYYFGEVYYGHPELNRRVGTAEEVVHSILHSPLIPSQKKRNRLVHHLIENVYSFGNITAETVDEQRAYRTVTRNIAFHQIRFPVPDPDKSCGNSILFITSVIPSPVNRGSVVRTEQMLRALIECGVRVDLIVLNQSEPSSTSKAIARRMRDTFPGLGAIVVRRHPRLGRRGLNKWNHKLALAVDRVRFRNAEIVNSSECPRNLVKAVQGQLASKPYSFVFLNYLKLAGAVPADWLEKTVVDLHDIQSDRIKNDVLPKLPRWLRKPYLRRFLHSEVSWLKSMKTVVCISPSDKCRIDELTVGAVHSTTITAAYEPDQLLGESDDYKHDLLFVGSNSDANAKSLFWFLKEVLPELVIQNPQISCRIVGRVGLNRMIRELPEKSRLVEQGNLQFDTYLDRVSTAYAQARVVIAPILMGTGMKIKVIEALAYGKPVVGTSVAFEGISVIDGESSIFADSAEGYVKRISSLLSNPQELKRISNAARKLWAAEYAYDASVRKIREGIVNHMILGGSCHE